MKHKNTFATFIIAVLLLTACNLKYNTDFAPPAENPKYIDVYPETINDLKITVERINVENPEIQGFNGVYGENEIVISAYQTPSNEVAGAYFKDEIVPVFDKMSSHSRGSINGQWYASGSDGERKNYGWVNTNWIFVISGSNEVNFNAGIDAFKFIELK